MPKRLFARASSDRPPKPVWPHDSITAMTADAARNQWVKRIRSRLYSFGVIWPTANGRLLADPASIKAAAAAALTRYQAEGPALHRGEGRPTLATTPGQLVTVGEIAAFFLQSKAASVATESLSPRTYRFYRDAVNHLINTLGETRPVATLRPIDFERILRKMPWGPTRRTNAVIVTRMLFTWAHDTELVDVLPRFGKAFRGAPAKDRRQARHRAGKALFPPEHLRALLAHCNTKLRAMILLGINGGMGNTDIARLTLDQLDLDSDTPHIDYPRPKTAIERRIPLWPQTVIALQAVIADRPPIATVRQRRKLRPGRPGSTPATDDLVFITDLGNAYVSDDGKTDSVALEFRKLCRKLGFRRDPDARPTTDLERRYDHLPRCRQGFYSLRRTFRTVADEAGDQHATFRIMGQTVPGMAGVYVQEIRHHRLQHVTTHVLHWLYPPPEVAAAS